MSIAVILGSAFPKPELLGLKLLPIEQQTPFGIVTLYKYPHPTQDAYVVYRHGAPHKWLPNQVPYRAHTLALQQLKCKALLITSSVGVMDAEVPLDQPLFVSDLLMPENRLPDGSTCTLFPEPTVGQGHLVLEEGLFSQDLSEQVGGLCEELGWKQGKPVVFAYVGGPRTKTAAENRYWAQLGAQVNSMTLGPEVVLANEAEIPTAALVIGHKYSVPGNKDPLDQSSIKGSLDRSQEVLEKLIVRFLEKAQPVAFRNRIYRF